MAINRTDHDTETPETASVSGCYQCARMLLPICLMTGCLGAVFLLAGIVSLIVFGGGLGRALTTGVGCMVAVFSLISYVVLKIKVKKTGHKVKGSVNRGLDLAPEDTSWEISDFFSEAVKGEVVPPRHDETQPIPDLKRVRPHHCEDVITAAASRAPTPSTSAAVLSVFEDKELFELEIVDHFEVLPSYEEATAGEYYNYRQN